MGKIVVVRFFFVGYSFSSLVQSLLPKNTLLRSYLNRKIIVLRITLTLKAI